MCVCFYVGKITEQPPFSRMRGISGLFNAYEVRELYLIDVAIVSSKETNQFSSRRLWKTFLEDVQLFVVCLLFVGRHCVALQIALCEEM